MHRTAGFSSSEFLIVLAMLIALAGVTVPQYQKTNEAIMEATLDADLEVLRKAVADYYNEHDNSIPGSADGEVKEASFVRALTCRSEVDGRIDLAGPCGPYLKTGIPANPYTGLRTVRIVTSEAMPVADGATGWIFHVPTRSVFANVTGVGSDGKPLFAR